jgi:hypothetical protein
MSNPQLRGDFSVGALNWRCVDGECRTTGPNVQPSPMLCVSLSQETQARVTALSQGGIALNTDGLKICHEYLASRYSRLSRDLNARLVGTNSYVITRKFGQTATEEGGLRFVSSSGTLLLVRPDGTVCTLDSRR